MILNRLLVLDESSIDRLFQECYAEDGYTITVDLPEQTVTSSTGTQFSFDVDSFRKYCLINGLDDIGLTLEDADDIKAFEGQWREKSPWLFNQDL